MGKNITTATSVAKPTADQVAEVASAADAQPSEDVEALRRRIAELDAELAATRSQQSTQSTGRKAKPGHRWVTPRFDHETRYGSRMYVFKADQAVELPNEVADWVTGTHGGVRSSAFYVTQ